MAYRQDFNFSRKKLDAIKRNADAALAQAQRAVNPRLLKMVEYAIDRLYEEENPWYLSALDNMKSIPVTIDEFVESEDFLGHDPDFSIWPSLREDLRRMNPDIWIGEDHIFQTFDGGATGTGKTVKATTTQAYQLYVMSCFIKPIKLWPRLSSNTPLLFVFQSVQERVTKRVIYEPFRTLFTSMPYVHKYLHWDKDKDNVLQFDNGIQVVPALAAVTNIVGQAIVSGILDEVNFMSVVQDSKQVVGARGQGGTYDQAQIIYNNLTRRRKSRFITKGPSPGIISVLSSVRYIGDFMDRRLEQIEKAKGTEDEERDIVVIRRAQYEAQPQEDYSGVKFRLLVGSVEYGTRILKDNEKAGVDYPENARVELVPIEYKKDFLNDPEGSLRDICGIATDVISPFITQRHKIVAAVLRGVENGMKPWVVNPDIELGLAEDDEFISEMPQIIPENMPKDKDKPRFVHVDLSITGDRCGIAIVKVLGQVAVAGANGIVETLPHFAVEQAISIKPSVAHELDIAEVRKWIISLKEYYGINIHTVTYDGFQSRESMQLLRKAGIFSMQQSVDDTMEPYNMLKAALYQDRVNMQDHELVKIELNGLEKNSKKNKVDHPPKGSKDITDAIAAALYTASQARSTRVGTGVSTLEGTQVNVDAKGRKRVTNRPKSPHRRVNR